MYSQSRPVNHLDKIGHGPKLFQTRRSILTSTAKNIGQSKTDVGAGLVDPMQALAKAAPKSAEVR